MTNDPSLPDGSDQPAPYDDVLRQRALKSLKAKQDFRAHLTSYLVVNGFLVALWAVTGRGYFWPIWPILGWGIGLLFHGLSLRWSDSPTQAQINAEADRIRRRDNRSGPQDAP
ncbi:MAG: 2TM domain-containing protein [Dermatophilaceae bacterium]